jgi:hypothetical protein
MNAVWLRCHTIHVRGFDFLYCHTRRARWQRERQTLPNAEITSLEINKK